MNKQFTFPSRFFMSPENQITLAIADWIGIAIAIGG
jgi:hypothetical protein